MTTEPSHTPCPLCGKSEDDEVAAMLDIARNRLLGILVGREHRSKLSSIQNDIMDCYLIENMKQEDIAEELGITQSAVSQHLSNILAILSELASFYETYPYRMNVFYD
tara:strand:+ start:539 stop:862 length:324 start_codon:yes stop_codon:yes gene_type:complete